MASSRRDDAPPASRGGLDWALTGASIRTLDPARPHASALGVRAGRFVAVGTDAEVRTLCDAATPVIEGRDLAVVPGLIDAHQHPIWGAELTDGVDLGGLSTLEAVRAALAAERRRVGPEEWVRGWNLEYAVFAGRAIEATAIEDAIGGAPALVIFFDVHTALATGAALAAVGITGPVHYADASEVVCVDGRPTGELRELSAYQAVLGAIPSASADALRRRVRAILADQHALGITGIHVMDGDPSTFAFLDALEAADELTMRLVVPLWITPETSPETLGEYAALRGAHGRLWRGGVAKFFLDGVIDTGTAWLREPDSEGMGTVPYWPEPERYAAAVARLAEAGFQCVTHAIGDRAVRYVAETYRAAPSASGVRHRIEHLESLPDEDVRFVGASGVVASMQPLHMQWRSQDGSDSWAQRLGPERAAQAFRTRDLLSAGARLALGSDWPVAGYDPREGMAWARLRRRPGDPAGHVFEPGQVLTAEEALLGYTAWAAAAVGEEGVGGRIAVGMRADLTAFAEDPVACAADDLLGLPVRLTVVDGRVAHAGADVPVPDALAPGARS